MRKNKMPILYDFKKYSLPRKGLFSINKADGKYILPGGWENEIKEYLIIGEDTTSFIYKLQPSEQGQWVGNKVIAGNDLQLNAAERSGVAI